ncbi:MAG: hypothetical protein ACU841_07820 [Gammaproteobacteria bacterium]
MGWHIIDQGPDIPSDPAPSLRPNFRQWLLPEVFAKSVAALNLTAGGAPWPTDKQLQDLHDQILRQPNRTLLEANEAIRKLPFKAQVDVDEITGEQDPAAKLIDFANPEQVDAAVESKRPWIYRNLAEWKDLNASVVARE